MLWQKLQIRRRGMVLLTMIAAGFKLSMRCISFTIFLNFTRIQALITRKNTGLKSPFPWLCHNSGGDICMAKRFKVVKRATIDGNALLLIKGIDPRVMFTCHRHCSAKACIGIGSKWEVFVNNDHTRTFVSIEVIAAGLAEITKQIQAVNEVYKLHNLPEFYQYPGPHNTEKQRPKVHHYQGTN
ncbi:unnamed protein product [Prunus brigantina]